MFWQSVINGLGILLHWQTYVVALMYLIISFLPFIVLMFAGDKADGMMEKGGCLLMLIQPVFQALAVFIGVATLYPLMMGGTEAAWSLPWMMLFTEPGRTLLLVGIMLVLSIVGAFMPIRGRANSFIMFIMGGTVLVFLTLAIHKVHPELGIRNIELMPGWFTIIGLVIAAAITSWLGILAAAAIVTLVFRDKEDIWQLIMMPLGSVVGFIPVAMYAAWIALQIQAVN